MGHDSIGVEVQRNTDGDTPSRLVEDYFITISVMFLFFVKISSVTQQKLTIRSVSVPRESVSVLRESVSVSTKVRFGPFRSVSVRSGTFRSVPVRFGKS